MMARFFCTLPLNVFHCFQPSKIELERHWSGHLLHYWWWSSYESDPRCPHNMTKTSTFWCESLCLVYYALSPCFDQIEHYDRLWGLPRRKLNIDSHFNWLHCEFFSAIIQFASDGSSVCRYIRKIRKVLNLHLSYLLLFKCNKCKLRGRPYFFCT
jgi:hypothetical protein